MLGESGRTSRRGVLLGAGSGWAALQLGLATAGAQAATLDGPALSPPLFLYDRSIEGSLQAAQIAADAGARVAAFHDDVGVPWLETIQPLWRQAPVPVVGLTHGGAFFCLEQLARSHRLTSIWQSPAAEDAGSVAEELIGLARTASPARNTPLPARAETFPDAPILWLLQPVAAPLQTI